ncbi:MAG: NADH-quinone oxidoreductase subunit L [Chloroflexi bacterium]|nr:NADH-quinone oxidoreductase subunit L [Chloroflexota bacterium]
MPDELAVSLLLALPLAGFVVTALVGRRMTARPWAVAVPLVVVTWLDALIVIARALGGAYGEEGLTFALWRWIPAGALQIDVNLVVDQLTAVLLFVVTTVGMLVHVYSIGYMAHDPGRWRFFAYLNLFMFSMLLLVLAGNFALLFAGWELVGLSSYLLIGFWYRRRSAALAAKKAFIVNRVGDVGFALGIFAIWTTVGTLDIGPAVDGIADKAASGELAPWMVTGIALLVFAGAVGKSAQFPLHVWLPDAMEGPTPVSALIHAATMVNAGVYLVARTNSLFAAAPDAMLVVASIGIFTAILAASIALTQTDIKRVLAYSTLSQLGYMFAALGVGAWVAAVFHLLAQGFTKGLLFLGSGSVIHAVEDEQDMRRMGGLARKIPITYATMLIGALAMAGIPPLVPFFSKDEILGEAFKNGFVVVWAIGLLVAGMTAFYMFRLIGLTFWGPSRVDPAVESNVHESPRSMTVPLVLLAAGTVVIGVLVGIPPESGLIARWLDPVFEAAIALGPHTESAYRLFGIDGVLVLASVGIASFGLVAAWRLFGVELLPLGLRHAPDPASVDAVVRRSALSRFLYRASLNKWWFDDINDLLFVRIGGHVARGAKGFDERVVDGVVNGLGRLTVGAGDRLRVIQTGRVQNYALGIAIGLIAMVGGYILIVGR